MVGGPPYFLLLMFLIGLSCNNLSLAQPMFWISEVYNNFYSFNDTFVEIYDNGLGYVTLSNISLELERQNKESLSVSLNDMMTNKEGFLVLSLNNADQVMRNILEKIQNETVNIKLIMADKPNQTEIIDVFKKEKGWSDVISCFRNESAVNAIVLVGSEPSKGKNNNCPLSPVRLDLVMFRTPFNLTVQLISHGIKSFPLTNHVFNFFKDETSVKMFSLEKYSTKNGKVNVTLDISQTFNMTSTYSINLELKINQELFVTLESLYFGAAPVPAVNLSHSFKTYPDKNPAQWVSPVYLQLVPSQSSNFASCYCEVSASTYNPFVSIPNSAARTKKCLEKCNDIISMSPTVTSLMQPKYDVYKYQSASTTSSSASPIVSATHMSQGATSFFGMSSFPSEASTSSSGTPENSISSSGTPENSISSSGTPENSTSSSGTPENSISSSGTPENSISSSGTPENSTSLSGTPENSTSLSGTPENSTSLSGTFEASTTLFATSESLFNNLTSLSATSTSPSEYPTSSEASESSSETSPTAISPSSIRMSNKTLPITNDTTTISSATYSLVTNTSVVTNSSNEEDYRTGSTLTAAQTTEPSTILASTREKTDSPTDLWKYTIFTDNADTTSNKPVTSTPTFAGSTQRPRLNLYINEFRFGQESYMGNWIELKGEQSRQPYNSYALIHYTTSHEPPTTLLLDHPTPTTKEGLFFILYKTPGANLLIRGLSSKAGLLKLVYKPADKSEELVDCVAYQMEGTVLDTELAKQCILHEVKQITRREYQQKWTIGRCSKQFEVLEPSPNKINKCPTHNFSHQIFMKILKTSPSKNFKTHFLTGLVQKLSADEGCMLSTAFFLDFFFNTSMGNINIHAHLAAPNQKKLDAVFMCYKTLFHKKPIKLQIGSDMVSVYRCHNSSCILPITNKAPVAVSKTKTILAIVIPLLVFVVCLIGGIYMYMRHKRKSLLSVLGVARYDADQDDLLVNMEEVGRLDTNFQNPTYSQLSVY